MPIDKDDSVNSWLVNKLQTILPKEKIKGRLIDIVSYASDAGFYYLLPKVVVLPSSEKEIISLFQFSQKYTIPLTFRAGGTSLSGQAISDGILVDISRHWREVKVEDGGAAVRVQPGVTGSIVNAHLKKFHTKIGPDPASISAAMMGGIIANNASGMCCGVANNSYHTTRHIKFITPSGHLFTTESKNDYHRFKTECPAIAAKLSAIKLRIESDEKICTRIRSKYKTKNTVGYSVNAFIDFHEPLDIFAHLLIGSEGTLGFIAEAVLATVPDYPCKASALLYFTDIFSACAAIKLLSESGAAAIELMDRSALRSVEDIKGVPENIKELPALAAALLVEFQGSTQQDVMIKVGLLEKLYHHFSLIFLPFFTTDPKQQAVLWKVRKGMFPSVGALRKRGTTVILEDIAFPVQHLGAAISDLHQLFSKYQYHEAIIFGHAKDGNIHFVITQAFDTAIEIDRYDRFMQELILLVVKKYNGALKAEHGTGRNMAPFVEVEWGQELYAIMKELKEVTDPRRLLNPGVIINEDAKAHIQHLKELPPVEEEVDKCIECGFCEHKCPSKDITLTPRRRITVRRELVKMKQRNNVKGYKKLLRQYQYDGLDTCAVDGLCATACPVDIDTGALVKRLRKEKHSKAATAIALFVARNFGTTARLVKTALRSGAFINSLLGKNTMLKCTAGIKKIVPSFPLWIKELSPAPSYKNNNKLLPGAPAVVYFPSCINRVMGDKNKLDYIVTALFSLAKKAGVSVRVPKDIFQSCCGQIFSSKGFSSAYAFTSNKIVERMWDWSDQGKLPVVMDISSCTYTLLRSGYALSADNKERLHQLRIMDSIEFLHEFIVPGITVNHKKGTIVLHPVCSVEKMGLNELLKKVAGVFADKVVLPVHAGCCGMAGDRGFLFPELTQSATSQEAAEVMKEKYEGYYSTGKTCEIALSAAVGENYRSVFLLADECTT